MLHTGDQAAIESGDVLTERSSAWKVNKLERCQTPPDRLRGDCITRMKGEGKVSGSVAEGGILRELVTEIEQAQPD